MESGDPWICHGGRYLSCFCMNRLHFPQKPHPRRGSTGCILLKGRPERRSPWSIALSLKLLILQSRGKYHSIEQTASFTLLCPLIITKDSFLSLIFSYCVLKPPSYLPCLGVPFVTFFETKPHLFTTPCCGLHILTPNWMPSSQME